MLAYAVAAVAALLSILVVVLYKQDSPSAPVVLPAPAAAAANTATAVMEPPRALPGHSGPAATQPRSDRASVNDPLGDQK
jgi:hypothetical protein